MIDSSLTENGQPYRPPWWYATLRAARFGNVSFVEAIRVPYGPLVQAWLLLAEAAEGEAQEAHMKRGTKQGT